MKCCRMLTPALRRLFAGLTLLAAAGALAADEPTGPDSGARDAGRPFVFRDVAAETKLLPQASGIRGHGAGWGDVDGDGRIDLYVATFHTDGSGPNRLLLNVDGRFESDDTEILKISTRGTGVVFADLDNDGDLDLYVGSMPAPAGSPLAQRVGHPLAGCSLFRNNGNARPQEEARFTNISPGNGACPPAFGGRSTTVLDYDGDGLLDLLVGEDPLPGYNGSPTKSSRLFRNLGELQFEDVSRKVDLPEGIPGLGVAAADVNGDGWPDFFLASSGGGNRLFLNDRQGKFREAPGTLDIFAWTTARGDDMVCGVAIGDVNRDGLPDIVLGQHYERPWREPVANRLYLHRGIHDGNPTFEDVTEAVGLVPLPMKAPHVEIQDFNNDGWPDLSTSIVKFADGEPHPVIFQNLGVRDGMPAFRESALGVNDFPTALDRGVVRTGEFFEKLLRDRKIIYTAPGPTGDFDNDGRLDMFLASWWIESPSLLLRNETPLRPWIQVQLSPPAGVNRMGIGSRINVYQAGMLGEAQALLGSREMSTGFGYASGQPAIAHFGTGGQAAVDIEVILPHGRGRFVKSVVPANQRVTLGPGD